MAIKSRYGTSRCPDCGKRINVGDMIENRNGRWCHEDCNAIGDDLESAIHVAEKQEWKTNNPFKPESMIESPKADFAPSNYQQAIFDFIQSGEGNAVVEAVAGSGKTTTLVHALEYVPKDCKAIFLAFNKHIAEELKRRHIPDNVEISTIHALGFKLIRSMLNNHIKVDEDKVSILMNDRYPVNRDISSEIRRENYQKRSMLRRMVSLAKATLVEDDNLTAVLAMAEHYEVDLNGWENEIASALPSMMKHCKEETDIIDYDDMIWLPLVVRLYNFIEKYDFVFVDEAQDLNASQIKFVLASVKQGGRIVAVGDRNQSLYGFRGADTEAIPRLIEMLHAKTLPLSISYRCPVSHVKRVQGIVPQIEPSPTAPDGEIKELQYKEFLKMVEVNDMVVCRTNAPLVKPAFEVIRSKRKAVIRGKDIGKSLITFIERFNATDINSLEMLMAEYVSTEYDRLMGKGKELQAEMLMDKVDTVRTIAGESVNIGDLIAKMEMLFDDKTGGVIFSSVHRAKGLEANRVFILKPELMPHPKAKQGWEQVQEQNCIYVAGTRSKESLYIVQGE